MLAVLALIYLTYVIWQQRDAVSEAFSAVSVGGLVVAVAAFTAMAFVKAAYHYTLVVQLHPLAKLHPKAVGSSFLIGQLLRYLPGKVWGLVYQASQLRQICPPATIVAANGIQMAFSIALTATLVSILLGIHAGYQLVWLMLPAAFVASVIAHQHLGAVGRLLASLLGQDILPMSSSSFSLALRSTGLLALDWLFFIIGFLTLGIGLVAVTEVVSLAVAYAGASVMAMAAVAVPAGIGVREALFVSTAELSGQTAGNLIVIGILARLAMTAGDALAAITALATLRAGSTND